MTNFIPIFPLDIVVFPGESLNLHIFEPRYKQLIAECLNDKKSFGIPSVLDSSLNEYGTLMEITDVVKKYDNGEFDIRTKGVSIFRILETVKGIPDKLYDGAIVTYPDNIVHKGDSRISSVIVDEIRRLYNLLGVQDKFPLNDKDIISYEIGHLVGLSKKQEYELLSLFTELQRLEYLRRHLNNMIPMVQELERMKERVQMNGHFRNLSLDDFNL